MNAIAEHRHANRAASEVVAVDIGGTHARFALATIADGRVAALAHEAVLRTADHGSFELAWEAYEQALGRALPKAAGIAVACPVGGAVLKLTNNPWVLRPGRFGNALGIDRFTLVNDFAAIAHAVACLGPEHLRPICGPEGALPATGVTTVVGPGTGLGVAQLLRTAAGHHVLPTEGGHIDFAPVDSIEDQLLARLRARFRRVSVERVVSGPAIVDIHETLAGIEGRAIRPSADDRAIWTAALEGTDSLAAAALDRFCLSLGSVAGDLALAHGARAVVIAGGLGLRLADRLAGSGFADRFAAKGRFEALMRAMPVRLITHPQPGLYGAAAAFASEHGTRG